MKTELCRIMTKNGSDKGSGRHNFTELYWEIFKDKRNEKLNIFELGLGTNYTDVLSSMGPNGVPGASLRGWKEFFPNSLVFGADIDSRILFQEERIKTFYCDQTSEKSISELWAKEDLPEIYFDIMVEDGLHEFSANKSFFTNSIHKLKNGGYYIVEDINIQDLPLFEENIFIWKEDFKLSSIEIHRLDHQSNDWDNNILVIQK